jgi:hypothetical protein
MCCVQQEINIPWQRVMSNLEPEGIVSFDVWGVVKRGLPVGKWLHCVLYPSTFHTENSRQLFHPFLIADRVFNINVRIQRILFPAFQQNAANAILRCCKKCTNLFFRFSESWPPRRSKTQWNVLAFLRQCRIWVQIKSST